MEKELTLGGMETNTQVNLKIISFTDKELILMRVGQNT